MTASSVLAGVAILLLPGAEAETVRRAAFAKATEDYATYVIPRCAGAMVEEYLQARADRDRLFVNSLGKLLPDYTAAVGHARKRDEQVVYHCFGPPPPPGAAPPDQVKMAQREEADRLGYAAEADRLFGLMVDARQSLFHKRGG